ncbi:hypothetical protein [Paenarthrobacter sp. Z7-10]|uniref:hypothetical protein n=1 Tax=Paenarthrobacter sp. Z7-10 TaxID=2787635 RepID=UPI0022A90233|nr:hypothetical protein [Paenarthrobacter sp. Z7-10]
MLTTSFAMRGTRYLLKLVPAENPHLVVNEAAHLTGAEGLKIPVVKSKIIGDRNGSAFICPVYDVTCTLVYGDNTLALSRAGKTKNLKARHWAEFADTLGLPQRAAAAANKLALGAADSVSLDELSFIGPPLRGAQRELRFRRSEFSD